MGRDSPSDLLYTAKTPPPPPPPPPPLTVASHNPSPPPLPSPPPPTAEASTNLLSAAAAREQWEREHQGALPWELAMDDDLWECVVFGWRGDRAATRYCAAFRDDVTMRWCRTAVIPRPPPRPGDALAPGTAISAAFGGTTNSTAKGAERGFLLAHAHLHAILLEHDRPQALSLTTLSELSLFGYTHTLSSHFASGLSRRTHSPSLTDSEPRVTR